MGQVDPQNCVIDIEFAPGAPEGAATDSEIADAALGILHACVEPEGQGGMVKAVG